MQWLIADGAYSDNLSGRISFQLMLPLVSSSRIAAKISHFRVLSNKSTAIDLEVWRSAMKMYLLHLSLKPTEVLTYANRAIESEI